MERVSPEVRAKNAKLNLSRYDSTSERSLEWLVVQKTRSAGRPALEMKYIALRSFNKLSPRRVNKRGKHAGSAGHLSSNAKNTGPGESTD